MRTVQDSQKQAENSLSQAFQDLDALIKKAAEMVALAETIASKINRENNDDKENQEFQAIVLNLGISNPVTKEAAGDIYHQELSKELAEFLQPIMAQKGGMMTLTDIYCIFNRARGIALISPDDLFKACKLFDRLGLPFKLRSFQSGRLVVQSQQTNDDLMIKRILDLISEQQSISAMDLARSLNLSVVVAQEELEIADKMGCICRDETLEGTWYYDNLILQTLKE